ncbi:MAG: hypothetical protein QHC90_17280 [Shinella sp.]|nr:hypothetical protein [Shinella sp.]
MTASSVMCCPAARRRNLPAFRTGWTAEPSHDEAACNSLSAKLAKLAKGVKRLSQFISRFTAEVFASQYKGFSPHLAAMHNSIVIRIFLRILVVTKKE